MVNRNKIVQFCEEYLNVKDFTDFCVNGLQIEGIETINKIVIGVSLSEKLIKAAVEKKAQMIIAHHGLFGSQVGNPPRLCGFVKNRAKLLMQNDINLCGFHLPLDAHPIIGNNISLCKLFGITGVKKFDVGFVGSLKKEIDITEFIKLIEKKLQIKAYHLDAGPKKVKRVGIISGGAAYDFKLAAELGADTYLCGQIEEFVVEGAKEAKINFINAGHYNTEKLGIINLGKLIEKKFGVDVEFVDVPNEI